MSDQASLFPSLEGQAAPNTAASASAAQDRERLASEIVAVLKTVYDPEIPVDIYELGLIYQIEVREGGVAYVQMTLTTPSCPAAELLPPEVEEKVRSVKGVTNVVLDLVWDPPWTREMMSEAARLQLNL
jgi:FeS assembly SUF system protein